jgi:predicted phosphohydrolase
MKTQLALYSDLHLDLRSDGWEPPTLDVDVVILAGDVSNGVNGVLWAAEAFAGWPGNPHVVYVMGNHEYYAECLSVLDDARHVGAQNVVLLEQDVLTLPGLRVLGCTLWSSFDLYGTEEQSMVAASRGINDFLCIRSDRDKRFKPAHALELFQASVAWLDTELAKPFDGKTVVVTHFGPHRGCVAHQYEGGDLTPYFVSDLSHLMARHRIEVWCYGHTHSNFDFVDPSGCRVVSNQYGYDHEAIGFVPDLIIEV